MRGTTWIIAALASIACLAFMASVTDAGLSGNDGSIKIHAGATDSEPIRANEPHPGCTFHIYGSHFDRDSTGTWRIVAWPPTGDGRTVVASGTWSASGTGEWRTAVMSLPSGHYKAYAKQDGSPGGDKQKVFWVECQRATPTPTPASTPESTPTPTPTSAPTTTPESTPTPTAAPTTTPESTPMPTAIPSPTQLGAQRSPQSTPTPTPTTPTLTPAPTTTPESIPTSAQLGVQRPPKSIPTLTPTPTPTTTPESTPTPTQLGVQQPPTATISSLPSTSTIAFGPALGLAAVGPLVLLIWRRFRR